MKFLSKIVKFQIILFILTQTNCKSLNILSSGPVESIKIKKFSGKFDKIYLINLDRSKERLETVSQHIIQFFPNYERFSAIDGARFKGHYIQAPKSRNIIQNLDDKKGFKYKYDKSFIEKGLSPGELGNYFSHYELLKKVLEKKYDWALILEDDIIFADDISNKLREYLQNINANWDIIYLNCFAKRTYGCQIKNFAKTAEGKFSILDNNCIAGNAAYIVNWKGAKKLLTKSIPAMDSTDQRIAKQFFTQKNGPFHAYCTIPELVSIRAQGSTIDELGR